MVGIRARGEAIRGFILDNVEDHPRDIVRLTAEKFGISRQAVNEHISRLIRQRSIVAKGKTRKRAYALHPVLDWEQKYPLNNGLEEDVLWRQAFAPRLVNIPDNALNIWNYGVTEMVNNAIDHSEGSDLHVSITRTAANIDVLISDNGEGIFRRITRLLQLHDERHAVLELAKGKLTTDPENHTGEGIFFSSRAFDRFAILSGEVYFSHERQEPEDWILEQEFPSEGTHVFMKLSNNTSRSIKQVFDEFSGGDDLGFTKTIVPVALARYGNEMLVSRSQAKRLLTRVDRFKTVILDFTSVDRIGQAFADEVFRVFRGKRPNIDVYFVSANKEVEATILRAISVRKA